MRIFLIGFMGSGKTHWGKRLGSKLHLPFLDLDSVIIEKAGKSISDVFAEKGEEYFRYLEKEMLEELVAENEALILSCGGGTPCFFNNIEFMRKHGTVVWLNTSVEVLQQRLLKERVSRPLIRDIEDADLQRFIARKLSERRIYYEQANVVVNEESVTIEELIQALLKDE